MCKGAIRTGLLATFILPMLFVGAVAQENKNEQDSEDYFPLKVGYQWVYIERDEEGEEVENKFEIVSAEKVGDVECYAQKDSKGSVTYFAVDKEGVKVYKEGSQEQNPPALYLKYPLKKGDEWEFNVTPDSPNSLKLKMKNEGEYDIEVPAGKMKCFKVTGTDEKTNATITFWFAKGIGIAKLSIRSGPGESMSLKLKSFSKGKKDDKK